MNEKILSSLLNVKEKWHSKEELEKLTDNLRSSFLSEWSETPDNIETSKFLNFGQVKNPGTNKLEQGLVSKSQNELISNILWFAFGDSEIPKEVSQKFPKLKKEEWNQIIRIAQMALCSFECQEQK